MSRLHSLPIDTVKIDRSFIDELADGASAPLVAATITMAHSLGLQTIAEGVEGAQQVPFLRLHGCDQAQGDLFGRADSADAIDDLLRERGTGRQWTNVEAERAEQDRR